MSESAVEDVRGVGAAYVAFREAVLDLSDAPTKANIVRYLDASRALDGWRPRRRQTKRPSGNRKRSRK